MRNVGDILISCLQTRQTITPHIASYSSDMSVKIAFAFLEQAINPAALQSKPIIFGISGPQGSGKTYLAESLHQRIGEKYPQLKSIKLSMDDVYLTNADQKVLTGEALTQNNKLLQGRGLPGTHDVNICIDILQKLRDGEPTSIPVYDKSLNSGEGDRATYISVTEKQDIVIFEGWFNGYAPLDEDQVRLKYLASDFESSKLPVHRLYQIEDINAKLHEYTKIWEFFNFFIFIDTDFANVYNWREEQEHNMISKTGSGMTDSQVEAFVDRYIPVYELYYRSLCDRGGCVSKPQANLRLVMSESRSITSSEII